MDRTTNHSRPTYSGKVDLRRGLSPCEIHDCEMHVRSVVDRVARWVRPGLVAVVVSLVAMGGCAEGMLWRTGNWAPWVQKKWQAEDEMAETLFVQRRQISEKVQMAKSADLGQRDRLAAELGGIYANDPVLLAKLDAIRALGQLPCETSLQILRQASKDPNVDLRLAAVRSMSELSADIAVPMLGEVLGSDTNVDVRLAATRALASFPGVPSAELLRKQLDDRNPAVQYTATESLELVTGQKLGRDIRAWKSMLGTGGGPEVEFADGGSGNPIK